MKLMSKICDERINSWNLYVDATFGEYLSFAKRIISNNEFQRKRVRASKSIYSLLKNDLKKGCVIPPLVLAITGDNSISIDTSDEEIIKTIESIIETNAENVLILDGLQRTYTLIDALSEIEEKEPEIRESFIKYPIRLEIYVNINKFGVLYRMLTLNTGQTPMPVRHQLEMLYRDKLDTKVEGITLMTDVDGTADADSMEFAFKNVIDGFNSYMNRNELPIDKQDMLDNIQMLENMSDENVQKDIFEEYLYIYAKVFNTLCKLSGNYVLTEDDRVEFGISESPFGKKVSKVFSTSQAMTGFGAAIGKMKDLGIIHSINDIETVLRDLNHKDNDWFLELLVKFDKIKATSKKIGNAQRSFFHYFFRELLNKESDSYLNLDASVENGYKRYYSQA